jgi:hypothetical protein
MILLNVDVFRGQKNQGKLKAHVKPQKHSPAKLSPAGGEDIRKVYVEHSPSSIQFLSF